MKPFVRDTQSYQPVMSAGLKAVAPQAPRGGHDLDFAWDTHTHTHAHNDLFVVSEVD